MFNSNGNKLIPIGSTKYQTIPALVPFLLVIFLGGVFTILTASCCMLSAKASMDMGNRPRSVTSLWADWTENYILSSLKAGTMASNGSQCLGELETIFEEAGEKRNIILDATGKPASGLLDGNLAWLGNYRQCVDESDLHYCLITAPLQLKNHSNRVSGSLSIGACLPITCTEKDIAIALADLEYILFGKHAKSPKIRCSIELTPSGDSGFICTMIFISLLCLLCLYATMFEHYWSHRSRHDDQRMPLLRDQSSCNVHSPKDPAKVDDQDLSPQAKTLVCFSLTRSINQITNTTSAMDDIRCLHGMRVISMFWIILGHSFSYQQNSGALANMLWVYSVQAKWFTSQVIYNAYAALDTFFFLGGLLMAYTGFKYMSKSVGRVNWLLAIVHRYLRITPAMGVMILLYTFVYPYLGDGPFWYKRVEECHECYQWWWTNFLYINNFVPENTTSGCLSWTWYLATDMQFFLFSIILIILIWWSPIFGILSLAFVILVSIIVRVVIFSLRDYAATQIINTVVGTSDYQMFPFSVKPYACATAYLVGVGMGYFLHLSKASSTRRLNVVLVLTGWLFAFTVGMFVVYGLFSVFDHQGLNVVPLSKAANVAYGCLKGLAWSVALSWVVFSCHHGYGGVINRFLSWSFWIPLSRLTFCAYLLHPAVIYLYTGSLSMLVSPSIISQSFIFAGFVTISYSAAFVLSALIEMPICSLQKMFLKR